MDGEGNMNSNRGEGRKKKGGKEFQLELLFHCSTEHGVTIPRGRQFEQEPESLPANREPRPSDRHFIQPRDVGYGGGACMLNRATPSVSNVL